MNDIGLVSTTSELCSQTYSLGTNLIIGIIGSLAALGLATAFKWAVKQNRPIGERNVEQS